MKKQQYQKGTLPNLQLMKIASISEGAATRNSEHDITPHIQAVNVEIDGDKNAVPMVTKLASVESMHDDTPGNQVNDVQITQILTMDEACDEPELPDEDEFSKMYDSNYTSTPGEFPGSRRRKSASLEVISDDDDDDELSLPVLVTPSKLLVEGHNDNSTNLGGMYDKNRRQRTLK